MSHINSILPPRENWPQFAYDKCKTVFPNNANLYTYYCCNNNSEKIAHRLARKNSLVETTYGELKHTANKLAASFLKLGIKKGDCVMLRNFPRHALYISQIV